MEAYRGGVQRLHVSIKGAIESEVAGFLAVHADKRIGDGRRRLVRHGHLPERSVMTGIGPVEVWMPRLRDRLKLAQAAEKSWHRLKGYALLPSSSE